METVKVLMSTYNGAEYLAVQLESVLAQKGVQTEILVRDDGSTDGTQEILEEYRKKGSLKWYQGENLRPCRSFLTLLADCGDAGYYAFCDQDDYWYEDKLLTAVEQLRACPAKGPKLYFCSKRIVDRNLQPLGQADTAVRVVSYGAAILNCVASGCTMVLNREAAELIRAYRPQNATMHDAWAYKLVTAFGTVIYDKTPHLDYRQHGSNEVGADKSFGERLLNGVKTIRSRKAMTYRSTGAREMLAAYGGKLSLRNRVLTEQLAAAPESFSARIRLIFNRDLKAQSAKELFFIKVLILLGWI